jgi:putative transcriptional regulator
MTQRQLAEKVGVTRQTIITIEANRYSPSLRLAFRIARAFGVSIEDVFQYSQPSADPEAGERAKSSGARGESRPL